ncbi:MAG: glutamate--tRNA ligase [Candidatus Nanopelagicales bacterium]|nr:glutamate--tRNA ligase [Candidatus Nanopelagicales bacterium]
MPDATATNLPGSTEVDENELVRVRFCPSPTGDPHVGMLRTALFNWAFARRHQGVFVFRIEDTDTVRDTEQSYEAVVDAVSWLGLEWDEGPGVGGDFGPYRQSQRRDIYREVVERLLESGDAYRCYCTPEELNQRREEARAAGRDSGYDGRCRDLTPGQVGTFEAENRPAVVRFRVPDGDWEFDDLIRGPMTFKSEFVSDFVLVRANGDPLYPLVNPVDDALMRITHVLRGEDLLSSTPRQLALHQALARIGIGSGRTPRFGHLPYVMGQGNKKLSKRDPESAFSRYQRDGFLPEGLANYLGLLGWSMGDDVEFYSLAQMAEAFDLDRVNASPARFDLKKCTAVNSLWVRALDPADLAARMLPFLIGAEVLPDEPTEEQLEILRRATPLVQERMELLSQAVGLLGFLFTGSPGCGEFRLDPDDAAKVLDDSGRRVAATAESALRALPDWDIPSIEDALRVALVEGLGLKPRLAFGPVRVAVTGRRVSPPLFESLELLGRERSLARLAAVAGP